MDALTKNQKKVLGQALRLLFDKSEDFKTNATVLELAQKFETTNADEIKNDLQFLTVNPF